MLRTRDRRPEAAPRTRSARTVSSRRISSRFPCDHHFGPSRGGRRTRPSPRAGTWATRSVGRVRADHDHVGASPGSTVGTPGGPARRSSGSRCPESRSRWRRWYGSATRPAGGGADRARTRHRTGLRCCRGAPAAHPCPPPRRSVRSRPVRSSIRRDSSKLRLTSGAPVLTATFRSASVWPAARRGHENQPVVQRLGAVDAGQHRLRQGIRHGLRELSVLRAGLGLFGGEKPDRLVVDDRRAPTRAEPRGVGAGR